MSDNSAPTKTISDFEAKLSEADRTVAAFDSSREGMLFRFRSLLREYPTSIPAMVLLLSVFCFGFNALFINPNNFVTATAFSTILQQVTVTGIVAVAQTIIILTAGIDLSVGAILIISAMVMGKLAVFAGVPVFAAVPLGMLVGGFMG
ncbi:MAG TPA: ABC transporter permease, partial [Aestuariivirga sp.]